MRFVEMMRDVGDSISHRLRSALHLGTDAAQVTYCTSIKRPRTTASYIGSATWASQDWAHTNGDVSPTGETVMSSDDKPIQALANSLSQPCVTYLCYLNYTQKVSVNLL